MTTTKYYTTLVLAIVLVFVMVVMIVSCMYWDKKETFFPEDEVKYVHRKNPSVAIAECHYQGMTPILTCSYESKI